MSKQFVKDLKIGSLVQSYFVVVDIQRISFSAPSKRGDYFLKLRLGDISGTIKAVIWDRSLVSGVIAPDDVLMVTGEVNDYQGPQLIINDYEKIDSSNINRYLLQPTCPRDSGEMWRQLITIASELVTDKNLQLLLNSFYDDSELVERFMLAPAAKVIHHNYLAGLLEHTLEVVEICRHLCGLYPEYVNKSLLITAAIFHDIGKIEEYDPHSFTFQQTDKGKLIGHITLGLGILREKIALLPSFPQNTLTELEHMIISHHGEKEWGSPEVPKTFNAYTLFHADLLSARLKQFTQVMQNYDQKNSSWTEWDHYLGRRIFTGFK
ncbi:MAG: 3'-5' exoribonuclease YhaM family protein [Dethiobacteria bacterium]|jgi:3'-5' exoribonuclease